MIEGIGVRQFLVLASGCETGQQLIEIVFRWVVVEVLNCRRISINWRSWSIMNNCFAWAWIGHDQRTRDEEKREANEGSVQHDNDDVRKIGMNEATERSERYLRRVERKRTLGEWTREWSIMGECTRRTARLFIASSMCCSSYARIDNRENRFRLIFFPRWTWHRPDSSSCLSQFVSQVRGTHSPAKRTFFPVLTCICLWPRHQHWYTPTATTWVNADLYHPLHDHHSYIHQRDTRSEMTNRHDEVKTRSEKRRTASNGTSSYSFRNICNWRSEIRRSDSLAERERERRNIELSSRARRVFAYSKK